MIAILHAAFTVLAQTAPVAPPAGASWDQLIQAFGVPGIWAGGAAFALRMLAKFMETERNAHASERAAAKEHANELVNLKDQLIGKIMENHQAVAAQNAEGAKAMEAASKALLSVTHESRELMREIRENKAA